MTKELSALLDGELETHEAPALWAQLKSNGRVRDVWSEYQLVRDGIRGEDNLSVDIAARVMDRLDAEPTVLAPRAMPRSDAQPGRTLALAASVAGVAVVVWLALAPQSGQRDVSSMVRALPSAAPIAQLASSPQVTLASTPNAHAAQEYREYLLAHQANAPGLHMQGGAQHIRTVSAIGSGQ